MSQVIRFVVDVHANDNVTESTDLEEFDERLQKLVHGVFTEVAMNGNENVVVTSHQHESTRQYSCETCGDLAVDRVNSATCPPTNN